MDLKDKTDDWLDVMGKVALKRIDRAEQDKYDAERLFNRVSTERINRVLRARGIAVWDRP